MTSTVVTAGLGLVYWVVAARLLSKEAVGAGGALISTMVVLSTFAQLNLSGALVRFVPVSGRSTRRLVLAAYGVSAVTGVILSVAALLVLSVVSPQLTFVRTDSVTALVFCGGVTLWTVFNLQDAVLTGLRRASWVPIENTAYAAAKLILLLLVPAGSGQATSVLLTWVLPLPIVLGVVTAFLLLRAVPVHEAASSPNNVPPRRAAVARFVAIDYVGSVFSQGVPLVLPLLVISTAGAAESAAFYICWVITQGVLTLASNIATSLTVEAAHDEARLANLTRTVLHRMAVLGIPVVAALVLLPGQVLRVFGPDYHSAAVVLQWLALAVLPRAILLVFSAVARVAGHLWLLVAVELSAGAATLALAALHPSFSGASGVALAWLLGQLLGAVVVARYLFRLLKVHR